MTYKIEDGIPLIARQNSRGRQVGPLRLALETMEVGQSFHFPTEMSQPGVSNKVVHIAKLTGRKFATRKVEGGYRIWRIE